MTPYEQIKAEVVKVCPEIMDLKFGCEIAIKNITNDIAVISDLTLYHDKTFSAKSKQIEHSIWTLERKDEGKDFEILGSPIELHHILRTISKTNRVFVIMTGTGEFFECIGTSWTPTGIVYNLSLPAALQSEETLKGLSELLAKNNK